MRKFILLLLCLIALKIGLSQQQAVTEKGEEVILFDDGTWKYKNVTDDSNKKIPTNSKKFNKNSEASFLLKSSKFNVGFWLNPKSWTFKKATENTEAEYELKLKNEDLYGMIITEQIQIPLKSLKNIAVENARAAAPNLSIVKEEYRIVNGIKVLHLQMNGTMQGIDFTYYGYYYSNDNGTVQFVTFTSQNLFNKYKARSEQLLNGLVETQK